MDKYVVYDIETLEDVKLAKTNIQTDEEETLEYISGSSIRGAFIYEYIKKNGIKDINQGIHRRKLLMGGIKFLNAYPEYDGLRSIPFPKAYFATKENLKYSELTNVPLEIKVGLDNKLPQEYERLRKPEFTGYLDGQLYRVVVQKISNLHINSNIEKNVLYRYEAIKRGQSFKGIIKVEDESYIDEVIELLNDAHIYIGGAKGSGYGRCRIKNMEILEENPEYELFEDRDCFEEYIYLIALSDIIYRNKYGQYKTYIDEEYLCKELGLNKVQYVDSIIETKNITSFNNKWNCHTPQIVGIKAGSVFKYKIEEDIDEDKLLEFMDRGIGERKLDGFGRFVIVDSLEDSYLSYEKDNTLGEEFSTLYNRLSEDEKVELKDIVNRIYRRNVEGHIGHIVMEKSTGLRKQNEMSKSQWGNFMNLFSYLSTLSPEEGIEIYKSQMKEIRNKRSISYKQLMKVKYGKESLINLFDEMIGRSTDLEYFYNNLFKDVRKVKIGDIISEIDMNFSYKTVLKVLVELIRYQKMGVHKEEGI